MTNKTIQGIGERTLLQTIRQRWGKTSAQIPVGIGDDAAVFTLPSREKGLITCDALIENIHFRRSWISPYQLGYKSLAVNLSDIAAMGGIPRFCLISLGLPADLPLIWVDDFYRGLGDLADKWRVIIAGGDTCASPGVIMINITLIGETTSGVTLLRTTAKIGDQILVTGNLGEAAAGLIILESGQTRPEDHPLLEKQLMPFPRCREAQIIAQIGLATAMMDISDGLAADMLNLTQASQVGARIQANLIPISQYLQKRAASLGKSALELALCGGEDYELLLTASPDATKPLQDALSACNCPLTVIGEILPASEGLILMDEKNHPHPWFHGYQHFTPQ
ncbi:MAG: thiamine-phosphate kinase [Candidatus Schekmanbacteria bacterium]|nr:thiamine-phosphate kinase [Candidatus Schekmanbacteria bacterium]